MKSFIWISLLSTFILLFVGPFTNLLTFHWGVCLICWRLKWIPISMRSITLKAPLSIVLTLVSLLVIFLLLHCIKESSFIQGTLYTASLAFLFGGLSYHIARHYNLARSWAICTALLNCVLFLANRPCPKHTYAQLLSSEPSLYAPLEVAYPHLTAFHWPLTLATLAFFLKARFIFSALLAFLVGWLGLQASFSLILLLIVTTKFHKKAGIAVEASEDRQSSLTAKPDHPTGHPSKHGFWYTRGPWFAPVACGSACGFAYLSHQVLHQEFNINIYIPFIENPLMSLADESRMTLFADLLLSTFILSLFTLPLLLLNLNILRISTAFRAICIAILFEVLFKNLIPWTQQIGQTNWLLVTSMLTLLCPWDSSGTRSGLTHRPILWLLCISGLAAASRLQI